MNPSAPSSSTYSTSHLIRFREKVDNRILTATEFFLPNVSQFSIPFISIPVPFRAKISVFTEPNLTDICAVSNPCKNNATCIFVWKKNTHYCKCEKGYTGTDCGEKIGEIFEVCSLVYYDKKLNCSRLLLYYIYI